MDGKQPSPAEPTPAELQRQINALKARPEAFIRWCQLVLTPLAIVGVVVSVFALFAAKGERGEKGDPGEDGRAGVGAPISSIVAWMSDELPSSGNWRICNGDRIAELGLNSGEGDALRGLLGGDRLPDFQGYFLRGQGGEGPHSSAALGQKQNDAAQLRSGAAGLVLPKGKPAGSLRPAWTIRGQTSDPGLFDVMKDFNDDETRPVNVAVHWIIRVK